MCKLFQSSEKIYGISKYVRNSTLLLTLLSHVFLFSIILSILGKAIFKIINYVFSNLYFDYPITQYEE